MKIPFHQLLNFSKIATFNAAISAGQFGRNDPLYSDTTGFHVYADLEMPLVLSAGDTEAATRNLQILQAFASAAEAVFHRNGLQILEDQGQRLHLFLETDDTGEEGAAALIGDCRIFYTIAKREIALLAGEAAFSIRMAADYGRAILLRSNGADISESLVSLGNPANRPAKYLAREVGKNGVPAGHLALNLAALVDPDATPRWTHIDLELEHLIKTANERAQLLDEANHRFGEMVALSAKQFEPNPQNPVFAPRRRTGFMFRADLDGFSSSVKEAMQSGKQAIRALVIAFSEIMQYPAAFKDSLPDGVSVLCFPWAGDCANLFLECDNYELERTALPNTAALNWHEPKVDAARWRRLRNNAEWLVAMAGGDPGEDHGAILTGNVSANGRTFHVGAGWSWRRSLDAEQATGTSATESVIQVEDHFALDENFKSAYRNHREHPTLFKVASLDALNRTQGQRIAAAAISAPAILPSRHVQVAAPRPYSR